MHDDPGVFALEMNGTGGLHAVSVKKHGSVAGLHAQHAAGVMSGLFGEKRLASDLEAGLRRVKTRISHGKKNKQ